MSRDGAALPPTMNINHGHTDNQVAVIFEQPVQNLLLTPEQAQAFIEAMQQSLTQLRAHMKNPKPPQARILSSQGHSRG